MKGILHLSSACNLRCKYCYAARTEHGVRMTVETARAAIELVSREGRNSFCVSFFGGEPLLHFPLIREVVPLAREVAAARSQTVAFRMSTNGLLFTPEILQFCSENGILFAISCDGNQQAHDAQRVFPDGSGSFTALAALLPEILGKCPHTVFSSVITPASAPSLVDSMNWMWGQGIRFVAHQLDFSDATWDDDSFQVLTRQYALLGEWYLEKTRSGEYFYLNILDDKLKTHIKSDFNHAPPCDFGISKVSVAPDGTLYPCVRFVSDDPRTGDFVIGHVNTGFSEARMNLSRKNLAPKPVCEGCAYFGRCIHYCGCNNFTSTGEIDTVHPLVCEHERMLIPIADALGEILWQEKNPAFLAKHYKIDLSHFPLLGEYDME